MFPIEGTGILKYLCTHLRPLQIFYEGKSDVDLISSRRIYATEKYRNSDRCLRGGPSSLVTIYISPGL